MKRNRWCIALAAVGIHISIGSVYAWSVLTRPVMGAMGLGLPEVTGVFSIAILFLGFSAAFLGRFVEHIGPRWSGLLSSLFFCAGLLGTGLAVALKEIWLLYFFYGCIGGIGLGVGYITPVATLVKWFPRQRGFATGLAIMGFGFAALLAGPAMQYLVAHYGLVENFLIMAAVYAVVMGGSALYLAPPRAGEAEALGVVIQSAKKEKGSTGEIRQYTRAEALHTWHFYGLWWIFFTNITCGIGLLAAASPMAQEIIGMDAGKAASFVGLIGIVNGAGRIGWSTLSDWLGRRQTYIAFFLLETAAFILLAGTKDTWIFCGLTLLIISCYGGGFSCMPAYLADLLGVRQLSSIHGSILTAWGMAGIAGPLLLATMKEMTGSYTGTLYVFAAMMAIACIVVWRIKMVRN